MVKRTGPTNPYLQELIAKLRVKSRELKAPIWKDLAEKLQRSTRRRVEVNLSEISRHASNGDVVVVPGVVLAAGSLDKAVNIAAWKFSGAADKKISEAKGKSMTIEELLKENPKGTNVRIMV